MDCEMVKSMSDREPPLIEHNPDEKRQGWGIYWAVWAMVAVFWILQFRDGFDWEQIALGFITGGVLATWAMEITGNKVPESWTRKTRVRRRP